MGIFDIGQKALMVSQTQLNVTSHNIANAATPGYNRQEVILEVSTPATLGQGGVSIAQIRRYYDKLIQNQIVGSQQDYGKSYTLSQTLTAIEQLFNEAQDLGLADPLNEFFAAWQEVASNPEGLTERNSLLQKADTLVLSAQSMEQGITDILRSTEEGISDLTSQINAMGFKISQLNNQIAQVEAGSTTNTANDLRDQRDELLKDLSKLVEVSYWEDKSNGSLTVNIGMKTLVSGNSVNTLSAVYNTEGNYLLKLDGQDITSRITKGEMGGLLAVRDEMRNGYLPDLRKLVATITNTVNLQHGQGYGLDGSTGTNFFNPLELTVEDHSAGAVLTAAVTDYSQLTLDEYTILFNGGNYEIYNKETGQLKTSGAYNPGGTTINLEGIQFIISGAVTDQDQFTVSPLTTAIRNFETAVTDGQKIAASGTAAGLPGDNTNALTLAELMDTKLVALKSDTFANYYKSLVAEIGTRSEAASDELTFINNFLAGLNDRRDSISGVSLDEEAADLIRFQRAYQAAARLIQTADEMFQTLLNL